MFRDAPGIADMELRVRSYDKLVRPEIEQLIDDANALSLQLFGITHSDTSFYEVPESARSGSIVEWEKHFEFLDDEFEEEDAFWQAFGIDICGTDGEVLECFDLFGRQMVCALKRLHPHAALHFAGGQLTEDQAQAAAEAWGRRLLSKP